MKTAKNFLFVATRYIVDIISSVFIGAWVARYLGPGQFGLFSLALSIVSIVQGISSLGLKPILLKEFTTTSKESNHIISLSIILSSLSGLIALFVAVGIAYLVQPNNSLLLLIVFILGLQLPFTSTQPLEAFWEAKENNLPILISSLTATLVACGLKIIVITTNNGLTSLAIASLVGVLINFTLLVAATKPMLKNILSIGFDNIFADSQRLVKASAPVIFSSLTLMVQARVDQVMLANMISDNSVGIYTAALKIPEGLAFVSISLSTAYYPRFTKKNDSSATSEESSLILSEYYKYANISISIGFLIAILIAITASYSVRILYGEAYSESIPILVIMSLRLLLAHYGVVRGSYLLNNNILAFGSKTMLIGTFINIALNIVLIPLYEGVGAAIATVASLFVTCFALDLFYYKTRKNCLRLLQISNLFPSFVLPAK
ncbi:flippase [Cyanobium sp. Aljojuca 7D2]|uniref:flippase n=1 Tax=Cyanobium sp. Aljojuca 7D2 TaxID=2823698 RepID=UPI0020CE328A|nr:flippase [Cyanobium sp. Aljojuca 7D2]MCP9889443.1 flippase [Cyanobium sp. Aljojuca 7D2]